LLYYYYLIVLKNTFKSLIFKSYKKFGIYLIYYCISLFILKWVNYLNLADFYESILFEKS